MFRLFKLMAYVLLGYAVYEFVQGLMRIEDERLQRSAANGPAAGSMDAASQPNRMNLTGPGEGQPVTTAGPDGATASHLVGRGVVSH